MKAQFVGLILHFDCSFDPADATAAGRKFLAAMPAVDGTPSEPWFQADAERITRPRADDFESGLLGIGLKNRAMGEGRWGGTLRFLHRPGLGSALFFSSGFWPDVATVWRYMREVATAAVASLRPVAATLGGLGPTENPAGSLRPVHVPRVFAPWTYVSLLGLPADLVQGVRSLPDCSRRDLADGVVVEPVDDVYSVPTRRFVQALNALPVVPPVTYPQITFPTPRNPT